MDSVTLRLLTQTLLSIYDGSVLVLALWRVSNLVANERGPWHCFKRLRLLAAFICKGPEDKGKRTWLNKACGDFHLHDLLECEYCNSMWLAPVFMVLYAHWGHAIALTVFTWLALSATTILIKRYHEKLQR